MKPKTVTLILLFVLAACAPGAAASASRGQVGGPPTIKLGPPDEGRQTSPALVIGTGKTPEGRAEIVAYGWKGEPDSRPADFCVWVEQFPEAGPLAGSCEVAPDRGGFIGMEMKIKLIQPAPARATYVGGLLSPDVASVGVSFRRPRSPKQFRVKPVIGWVRGDLQQRLGQPAPFGFYYAKVNGLVEFRRFRVEALNSEGEVIGARGN